jgi:hypothetical protein
MLKKIFFVFFFSFLTILNSCNSKMQNSQNDFSNIDKFSIKITNETAKDLLKEKNLKMIGYGGKTPNQKILTFRITFNYEKPLTIPEARELLVYSVNKFVKNINNYNEIKPYLANYPVTEKNIEIIIISHGLDGRIAPIPFIAFSDSIEGTLQYQTNTTPLTIVHEETFEEAEQIVKEANK